MLESQSLGFLNDPEIARKIYNREQLALVNATYEELVANPLVSKDLLQKTKMYIKEERLLHHILISHKDEPDEETSLSGLAGGCCFDFNKGIP